MDHGGREAGAGGAAVGHVFGKEKPPAKGGRNDGIKIIQRLQSFAGDKTNDEAMWKSK